jgi:hypothetical protein
LQPYPIVAADALLAFGTDVISDVLSLDEHLLQTNTFPEMLPVGELLSYSVLPYQYAHCYMLHEQQKTILMRSNV